MGLFLILLGNIIRKVKTRSSTSHLETNNFMELPMSSKKPKVVTPADELKKKLIAKRRKEQVEEQNENDKNEVIKTLLYSTPTLKTEKEKPKPAEITDFTNYIQYHTIITEDPETKIFLSFSNETYPEVLKKKSFEEPGVPIYCSIKGCNNPKRYHHSKTLQPICSLSCYNQVKI